MEADSITDQEIVVRIGVEHIDMLAEMLKKPYDEGRADMPANPRHFKQSLAAWLNNPGFGGFCTSNAACMGVMEPDQINFGIKIAHELCWLSNGDDGWRVLRKWEEWAMDMGATHILVHTNVGTHNDQRTNVMESKMTRKGYHKSQIKWFRPLI